MTRIKICCIRDEAEARLAVRFGARAIGLVGPMPSGPGVLDEATIRRVAKGVPAGVETFLLSSRTEADGLAAQVNDAGVTTLQIVDRVAPPVRAALRRLLPGVTLVQVVHVAGPAAVEEALEAAEHADVLLLDSGNPNLAVKQLGGTGRTHDWSASRAIRDRCGRPVYLAGGLRPENVRAAIETVEPFGVDVCTGVRTAGALDPVKLAAFVEAALA